MDRKESIRAAFSRAAGTYDAVGSVQRWTGLELARLIAESNHERPVRSAAPRILEVGCGTGGLTGELRRLFPTAAITALDFSSPMLAIAQAKLHDEPGRPPIDWRLADGELFEPPVGTAYDLIASSGALQWFDDLPAALTRFRTSLAIEGRLAFALFGRGTFAELQEAWRQAVPTGQPVVASQFLSPDDVRALVAPLFPAAVVSVAQRVQAFGSLRDLLVHCRTTGVSGGARVGGLLSPAALRRVEAFYRARFGEIKATYEVIFVVAPRGG